MKTLMLIAASAAACGIACALVRPIWRAADQHMADNQAVIDAVRRYSQRDPWGSPWYSESQRSNVEPAAMAWYSLGRDRVKSSDDIWVGWCNHERGCNTPHLDYWAQWVDQYLPLPYRRPWACVGGAWLLLVLLIALDRLMWGREGIVRRWLACAGGVAAGIGAWLLGASVLMGHEGWQPFDANGQLRAELQLRLPALLHPTLGGAACWFGVVVAGGLWTRGGKRPTADCQTIEPPGPAGPQGDELQGPRVSDR